MQDPERAVRYEPSNLKHNRCRILKANDCLSQELDLVTLTLTSARHDNLCADTDEFLRQNGLTIAELHEGREPAIRSLAMWPRKTAHQLAAAFLVAALLQQQGTEPLLSGVLQ